MKKVFLFCTIIGFIIMIGTAGASDINAIDFKTIVLQSCIGMVLALVGFVGYKVIGE